MKAGGLYAAIAVLIVLAGTIWWLNKHPPVDKTKTPAATKLISADPAQMRTIRIAKAGSPPVVLVKLADTWEIKEPAAMPADSAAVTPLAGSLGSVNADRLIDDHPSNLNEFGLADPSEEVDVTLKNGKTQKLLLGGDTPTGSSTYAKLADDPKVYTVSPSLKNDLGKGVNDLREKRLMTFDQNKAKSITLTAQGRTMEFANTPDAGWHFVKPADMRADGLLVDDLVRRLADTRMDLTGGEDRKTDSEMFASGKKIATATATDDRGAQTMEVRQGKDKNYYAKSSATEGVFKIVNDVGAGLDKSVDDFRNKKVFDFGFNEVKKLDINGQPYEKSGEKWTANKVRMDSDSIQNVIDKLRDLTAAKLTEKAGGVKTLTFTLTYGESNKVEKVVFNKEPDGWNAQREGEPTIYVLDAKAVDELQKTIAAIKQYQPPKNEGKKK